METVTAPNLPDPDLHAGMTRRAFTAGAAVSLFVAACQGPAHKETRAAAKAPPDPAFLHLSQTLTGHEDLDAETADRIAEGFGQLFPDLKAHFPALEALAHGQEEPTDLLKAADAAGLAEAALAIVTAWYTGAIGKNPTGISVAYADALMNRPVADGLAPPTYELGGPAWWTAEPPLAGVSAPVDRKTATVTTGEARKS
jgi:hypothetical protein